MEFCPKIIPITAPSNSLLNMIYKMKTIIKLIRFFNL